MRREWLLLLLIFVLFFLATTFAEVAYGGYWAWIHSLFALRVSDMMDLIYPLLTVLAAIQAALLLVYWFTTRRIPLVLAGSVSYLLEAVVTGLLAVMTGDNPTLDIEQYRYLVTWLRATMVLALLWNNFECIRMIFAYGTHERPGKSTSSVPGCGLNEAETTGFGRVEGQG